MDTESYRKKLDQFNSTEKYRKEIDFITFLIDPSSDQKILDYGCGTGFMVNEYLKDGLDVFGYDPQELMPDPDKFRFRSSFHFPFDKIYFMHSIAHIRDIYKVFENLKANFLKTMSEVSVITPNKDWIDTFDNPDYVPDSTVVKHFTSNELEELFVDFEIVTQGKFGETNKGEHERLFLKACLI